MRTSSADRTRTSVVHERPDSLAVPVHPAPLGPLASGWFTGRSADPEPGGRASEDVRGRQAIPGHPSNLSHRRPHRPVDLRRARRSVGRLTGTDPVTWHLMQQVHGADVGVVHGSTPVGAELRRVDALVTVEPGRVLGVSVADCVPVLMGGRRAVAAIHAGRAGVALGVIGSALSVLHELGERSEELHAAVGPAIGGCCYEVPVELREQVAEVEPTAHASTTWGTPSLDLPAAVAAQLQADGVRRITRVGGCTRCDPASSWFSHRVDATTGRQFGLVVAGAADPDHVEADGASEAGS